MTDQDKMRFLAKIEVDPNTGCWNWTASKNAKGYGWFGYRGRTVKAHRWAYVHLGPGPIPAGAKLDHFLMNESADLCSRRCVNPDHLEPVSNRVNLLRSGSFRSAMRLSGLSRRKHDLPEGVSPHRKKFMAVGRRDGIRFYLGLHMTPDEAHAAVQAFNQQKG